jgi:hypothetical protein
MISKQFFGVYMVAMAAVLCALIFWPQSHGDSEKMSPVNLTGVWIQQQGDDSSSNMTAEILDGHIQIMMHSEVVNGLYWDGSFNTRWTDSGSSSFQIISTAATNSLFLSQDNTKVFTYKNGVLSYDFRMLGITKTVHLSRGA